MALLLGVANAFDAPARLSFVLEMVDRKDLANAIAFNSMLFNLGVLIGSAAAGLVYVSLGPA
jgi:predicted MFS family arabinose efflux permease